MTLIVGVLCSDGVVLCSDQQVTHGGMGVHTVGQKGDKLQILEDKAVFGTSGHRGVGQQLTAEAEKLAKDFYKYTCDKANSLLQKKFREILEPAYQTARLTGALGDVVTAGILVAPFKDGLHLVEYTPNGTAERMTPDIPFISIGSGKSAADSLLGLLSQVYWPNRAPTLAEGKLAAYWTVQHAIDMRVLGVSFEPDMYIIHKDENDEYAVAQFDEDELEIHSETVSAIKAAMQEALDFSSPAEEKPPTMGDSNSNGQ